MDPHGPIAKRFPLVARFRPACLPLTERVSALVDLADEAEATGDPAMASAVFNQAALVASDLALPGLARELCHRHATAYLRACPLPAASAIRALEPIVNLARLQIRAGHADDARRRLGALYEAVAAGTSVQIDAITVPADLVASVKDRQEVQAWLWRVLLADGTRALTTLGRWDEALAHLQEHRGIGIRMLDGRQVAVIGALIGGDTHHAAKLLAETAPGDPWEQTVTACLAVLGRRAAGQLVDAPLVNLVQTYLDHKAQTGMALFDIRLGLTVLDALDAAEAASARYVARDLYRRTTDASDGYAAREILTHPMCTALATRREARNCGDLVRTCALGAGTMPDAQHAELTEALLISDSVLRRSLATLLRNS
ncbi:hypothetical protein [Streptomyces sp. MS2.AVA.5]|uniref:Uncharacterized protein n=1 Tax=Streptomyces achmelvichensis TaxID=3134111 RepID=A0ACC6PM75_9ACTN